MHVQRFYCVFLRFSKGGNTMEKPGKRKVILAIDDVTMNLAIIKGLLSKHFDVRVAKSGELALFILGSVKVDLILLDVEMPGMSGFEFIDIIREIPDVKDIPIIFVTSHATVDIISRATQAGAIDYIVKPIDQQVVLKKVFSAMKMPLPT